MCAGHTQVTSWAPIGAKKQVRMRLDNEAIGNGLQLVPETYGMDVPNSCTIVIIAGEKIKLMTNKHYCRGSSVH